MQLHDLRRAVVLGHATGAVPQHIRHRAFGHTGLPQAHAHGVPKIVHVQIAKARPLPRVLPARVVHGLDAAVFHQRDLVGVGFALTAVDEHVARVLAAGGLDYRLGDRVAHDQAATLLALDVLARHIEHGNAQLGDLDLPIPFQAADHVVAHTSVQDEQRHAGQVVG